MGAAWWFGGPACGFVKGGVAAERSAKRACERSSDWRRGAAGSPDPYYRATRNSLGSRLSGELVFRPALTEVVDVQGFDELFEDGQLFFVDLGGFFGFYFAFGLFVF